MDGDILTTTTQGQGRGGNIEVAVGQLTLMGAGLIESSTAGSGAGGAVMITATDSVPLVGPHSGLFTQATGGGPETTGGNITLAPDLTIPDHSPIMAHAFAGRGGTVSIVTEGFLAEPTSLVSASSVLGISGTVDIRAPLVDLCGTLAPLPQAFLQPVLADRCAERRQPGPASSLVQGRRDRVPADPGGVFAQSPLSRNPGDCEPR